MKIIEGRKTLIVCIGFLLGLVLVYILGIRKTWTQYQERMFYQETLARGEKMRKELSILQKSKKEQDSLFIETSAMSGSSEIAHLSSLYANEHHAKVHSFERIDTLQMEQYIIDTYKVSIQGSFNQLLYTIKNIETSVHQSALVSVDFYTEEDRRNKKLMLNASLFFRNARKK